METDRRAFLSATGSAFAALLASGCMARGATLSAESPLRTSYGPLVPDPAGILDLPPGFSYHVLSSLGDAMGDGATVPDKADGMGCFDLGNGEIALVRNHELIPTDDTGGPIAHGFGTRNGEIVPGGTTNIVLDAQTLAIKRQFRSLGGTIRNCSGGITPWGSWLTCEEAPTGPGQRYGDGLAVNHGWVFEVPAAANGLVKAVPLRAMGRFNHEAAAVDPGTGIVYMTEDRDDGLLYRFLPRVPGDLKQGGRLQALVIDGVADSRNWQTSNVPVGKAMTVRWIDLDNVESPEDDLRKRGSAKGATLFARGEGIHMGLRSKSESELYFCCTSGGAAELGQIFRLTPGRDAADMLELFFESASPDQFNYGDNLTVAPNGDLIVCEDQYTDVVDNHLRLITPDGSAYPLGRLRMQTELAGACFSPDGKVLFVNAYSPTKTFAISGPWQA
ncbi:MAG: alkaline phosphatase PhoX [Pseudomonadota bacterium]